MFNKFIKPEYKIAKILTEKRLVVSVAESCTGGLVSSRLTDVSGSSAYIKENFVTYSNESKKNFLGVSEEILAQNGAVSEECAKEMAQGLYKTGVCDIALCTTGIAGPTGGSIEKPVGTMFLAIKSKMALLVKRVSIKPKSRKKLKYEFSQQALLFLLEYLKTL